MGQKPRQDSSPLAAAILRAAGFDVTEQFAFHPTRRWRADLLVSDPRRERHPILVEIEGINAQGTTAHQRIAGYLKDMEKYREAAVLGFPVLRFAPREIKTVMLDTVSRYFRRQSVHDHE